MQRSFRFLKLKLTKLDRFHLRNVESRISARALFERYFRTGDLRPAAPPSTQQAGPNAQVPQVFVPCAVPLKGDH